MKLSVTGEDSFQPSSLFFWGETKAGSLLAWSSHLFPNHTHIPQLPTSHRTRALKKRWTQSRGPGQASQPPKPCPSRKSQIQELPYLEFCTQWAPGKVCLMTLTCTKGKDVLPPVKASSPLHMPFLPLQSPSLSSPSREQQRPSPESLQAELAAPTLYSHSTLKVQPIKYFITHCLQVLVLWTRGTPDVVWGLLGVPKMLSGSP